jgi:hypothetical protein
MKRTLPALIALVLFAVPAFAQAPDITGKWEMSIGSSQGSLPATLTVTKEGDKLAGLLSSMQGDVPTTVTLKEKAVSIEFAVQTPNGPLNIIMSGTVDGDAMKGTADFGGLGSGDWSAKKGAAAAAPAGQAPSQDKPAATLTGTWAFEVTHAAGVSTPTVTITQTGEKLSGKYSGSYGESELTGTIKGTEFTFTVEIGTEQKVKVVYTGTLATDTVKGNVSMGELGEGTFTGKRK